MKIKRVFSKKQALEFFLENHEDSCECINGSGENKIVDSFPDAEDFFNQSKSS